MTDTFTRKIRFYPAWDKRNPDPKKNYGIHGVEIKFLLTGEKGVIQFVVYTGWFLPHLEDRNNNKPMAELCEYLDGKPCYYDGSSLQADPILEMLIAEGDEAVWAEMESRYNDTFNNEDENNGN